MSYNLLKVCLCLPALLATSSSTWAEEMPPWELKRDKDSIQVSTRSVPGSKFKAVLASMTIDAELSSLVGLVQDADACSEWASLCKTAEQVEAVSETEMYVYTLNDLPWPVSDRDAVAHVKWNQDPGSLAVTMTASLVAGKVAENKGVVRLSYGETSWTFTPIENGRVRVDSHAHIDPGGATPAWLTNRLLVDSPFETMVAMRDLVGDPRYQGLSFDFLTER